MEKLTKKQKGFTFIMAVILLTMLNNLEHCAYVYHNISKHEFSTFTGIGYLDLIHAVVVVVILDLSVIAFVMNGKHFEAGVYTFFLFLLNLLYYDGLRLFDVEVNQKIAEAVYSAMFTYSIYRFSYLYFDKKQNKKREEYMKEVDSMYEDKLKHVEERETSLEDNRKRFEIDLLNHEELIKLFKSEVNDFENDKNEWLNNKKAVEDDIEKLKELRKEFLKCPQCNKQFEHYWSLRGHLKVHSDKHTPQEIE